jgi:hypothetical protein
LGQQKGLVALGSMGRQLGLTAAEHGHQLVALGGERHVQPWDRQLKGSVRPIAQGIRHLRGILGLGDGLDHLGHGGEALPQVLLTRFEL